MGVRLVGERTFGFRDKHCVTERAGGGLCDHVAGDPGGISVLTSSGRASSKLSTTESCDAVGGGTSKSMTSTTDGVGFVISARGSVSTLLLGVASVPNLNSAFGGSLSYSSPSVVGTS